MEKKRINFLCKNLAYQVSEIKRLKQDMHKASWTMRSGVILTGEDAEFIASVLEKSAAAVNVYHVPVDPRITEQPQGTPFDEDCFNPVQSTIQVDRLCTCAKFYHSTNLNGQWICDNCKGILVLDQISSFSFEQLEAMECKNCTHQICHHGKKCTGPVHNRPRSFNVIIGGVIR